MPTVLLLRSLVPLMALAAWAGPCAAGAPVLDVPFDQGNAEVVFEPRVAGILRPQGGFDCFSGELRLDEADPARSAVSVRLLAGRIHVGLPGGAERLRSPDYFDAAHYPDIEFHGTGMRTGEDGGLAMSGRLTLRGVTRVETLAVTLLPGASPGSAPAGFLAEGVIRRSDFGMTADPVLVGDEIRLRIRVAVATPLRAVDAARSGG